MELVPVRPPPAVLAAALDRDARLTTGLGSWDGQQTGGLAADNVLQCYLPKAAGGQLVRT